MRPELRPDWDAEKPLRLPLKILYPNAFESGGGIKLLLFYYWTCKELNNSKLAHLSCLTGVGGLFFFIFEGGALNSLTLAVDSGIGVPRLSCSIFYWDELFICKFLISGFYGLADS